MKSGDTDFSKMIENMLVNNKERRYSGNENISQLFDRNKYNYPLKIDHEISSPNKNRRRSMNDNAYQYNMPRSNTLKENTLNENKKLVNNFLDQIFVTIDRKNSLNIGYYELDNNSLQTTGRDNSEGLLHVTSTSILQVNRILVNNFLDQIFENTYTKNILNRENEETNSFGLIVKKSFEKENIFDIMKSRRFTFAFDKEISLNDSNKQTSFYNNISVLEPNLESLGNKEFVKMDNSIDEDESECPVNQKPNNKFMSSFNISSPKNNNIEEIKNKAKQFTLKDFSVMSAHNIELISKLQGAWRAYRDVRCMNILRENIFILQRSFRKMLITKYDLPDNYFYMEKYLKLQHQKHEKNYLENIKFLFPNFVINKNENSFSEGHNNTTNNNSYSEIDLSQLVLTHSAYEDEKIHLFAKILDFDLMVKFNLN
jgi:hypothetical protein